jgi:pre-mRNA-splicing factor 18
MYLKPLLKLLKKNSLSDDIRDSLSNMVKYIMHKDYILANEKYMEMAIGNAPWPIGVTNAGIHARPGRERIYSKHVAHALNDESQRRWIQVGD